MSIKRYKMAKVPSGMLLSDDGRWCKYADHESVITEHNTYLSDCEFRLKDMESERDALQVERDRHREAAERMVQWCDAYPIDVFPEPDFKKAHELLKAGGMGVDSISASNMRHVITHIVSPVVGLEP